MYHSECEAETLGLRVRSSSLVDRIRILPEMAMMVFINRCFPSTCFHLLAFLTAIFHMFVLPMNVMFMVGERLLDYLSAQESRRDRVDHHVLPIPSSFQTASMYKTTDILTQALQCENYGSI